METLESTVEQAEKEQLERVVLFLHPKQMARLKALAKEKYTSPSVQARAVLEEGFKALNGR